MGNETGGTTRVRTEADEEDVGLNARLDAARRLVEAIAARDYKAIYGALSADVRFRYLVPSGPGALQGAADVAAKYFGWFGETAALEVENTAFEPVSDRTAAAYRFRVRRHEGWEVVEQQTFVDIDQDGRIAAVDLVCSGFRPAEKEEVGDVSGKHRFDAGTLGCADGLAQEFRRRISAIPQGDVLEVETADPAAKEDLPPLARMMGHTVLSVEPSDQGRLLITVERGR